MYKIVKGKKVKMTEAEISAFEAEQEKLPRDTRSPEEILMEQKTKELEKALQDFMNQKAKSLGFIGDSNTQPYRAISNYVGYDNEYRATAEKLGVWFAKCFKKAETIQSEVVAGSRTLPTVDELLAEMPEYEPTATE